MSHLQQADLVADVVLDRAVWALDRPLTYRVPPRLAGALSVGSIVRVPLRGRRVRGWVVGVRAATEMPETLVPVAAVSGAAPVFDEALLSALGALARRYVQPLAAFLRLVTPGRMGGSHGLPGDGASELNFGLQKPSRPKLTPPPLYRAAAGLAPEIGAPGLAPGGVPSRVLRRLGPREDPLGIYVDLVERGLRRGLGAIVVVPEVGEGGILLGRLGAAFPGEAAVVHSGRSPAERAGALWSVAQGERRVVLGSRAAVLAPGFPLGTVIVHQEHDRSLKETRAPYYDAREVAAARAAATGASLLLASRTPSVSSWHRTGAGGWEVVEPPLAARREGWPIVEVVEPAPGGHPGERPKGRPGGRSGSVLPQRVVAAVLEARRAGEPVLVLVLRTRATPAGPGPREVAAYLQRALPDAKVTRDGPGDVTVTTKPPAEGEKIAVRTAAVVGVDAILERAAGRASEEGFVALWGLASGIARGSPRARMLVETRDARHHAIQALTRADYGYFLRRELEVRRRSGSPPFSALIRLRIGGPGDDPDALPDLSEDLLDELEALPGTEVLGPMEGRRGAEVLLKVQDRSRVLDPLRAAVSSGNRRIRVEMDPPDW
jgi:primosomal protein N'